jgi:5-methylthioadenosine/S-adenosylhomocysteine deaminase
VAWRSKDGRVVAVGTSAEMDLNYSSRQVIEATGKVVIPGLINGHTHVPMTLIPRIADDLDLQEWLTKYIFPAEAKNVTEDFVRVGYASGSGRNDSQWDHDLLRHVLLRGRDCRRDFKAGMRGVLGETVIDFPVADNKTNAEAMAYVEKFVSRWKGNSLIVPAIAPHAPYTVSEEHLKAVRAFSDRTGAPIVIHISETNAKLTTASKTKARVPSTI